MIIPHKVRENVVSHISRLLKEGQDEKRLIIRVQGMGASRYQAQLIIDEAKKL